MVSTDMMHSKCFTRTVYRFLQFILFKAALQENNTLVPSIIKQKTTLAMENTHTCLRLSRKKCESVVYNKVLIVVG